eukprot:TRINITY_DN18074_c0_g1_i1.p1 TRINITY_DN18074_c0_g1~~TRINITY_DN18074_c0_g1_i1.p1  ORF type:complete len:247 (-),score=32.41 TRINITY_DN18074_c0_g1_i1:233-973(-)
MKVNRVPCTLSQSFNCYTERKNQLSNLFTFLDGYRRIKYPKLRKKRSLCVITQKNRESIQSTDETDIASKNRRLILLRHAKSSWDNPSLKDHDRPLSKEGREDAATIAKRLCHIGWLPELILCSDATRTRQTLKIMQECVREFLVAEIHFIASFYSVSAMDGQTAQHLQQVICRHSKDDIMTVMCMGHNRGWEEAASMLCGVPIELKTSNAALLQSFGNSWEETFSIAGFGGWNLVKIVTPDKPID